MGLTYEAVTDRSSRAEGVWGSAFSPQTPKPSQSRPSSPPASKGPALLRSNAYPAIRLYDCKRSPVIAAEAIAVLIGDYSRSLKITRSHAAGDLHDEAPPDRPESRWSQIREGTEKRKILGAWQWEH